MPDVITTVVNELLWVSNDDGTWSAEIDGREHDYGDGLDLDVFRADVSPTATDGIWRVVVEHWERGHGAVETHLTGPLEEVLRTAEVTLQRFRANWEEQADAEAERRESLDE